jgi:hypothetical protein
MKARNMWVQETVMIANVQLLLLLITYLRMLKEIMLSSVWHKNVFQILVYSK